MATKLLTTFNALYPVFNNGFPYDSLTPYLHNQCVVKKVDDADSISGIANLIYYLNGTQGPSNPKFQPTNSYEWPPNSDNAPAQVHGIVYGPGTYWDATKMYTDRFGNQHGATQGYGVNYAFCFLRSSGNDPWLLISAVAQKS